MKKLEDDYVISGDRMYNMSKSDEDFNFKLVSSEFYTKNGNKITVDILQKPNQQIFHMIDGRYINEVIDDDDENEINYYYSYKIEELY